jgi:glutamate dehydrogenase
LRREIISTQLANDLVNHMGIPFLRRLPQSTGSPPSDLARGYVVAGDVFKLKSHFASIEALDYQVPAEVQLELMDDLMRLGRRATRWFVRNRRRDLDPEREIAHFAPRVEALAEQFDSLLEGPVRAQWEARFEAYSKAGVPEPIARLVAGTTNFFTLLGIIEAADTTGQPEQRVAQVFFALGSELRLPWFGQQINGLSVDNHWQALARESYRDDLDAQARSMTVSVMHDCDQSLSPDVLVKEWVARNPLMVKRWRTMLSDLKNAGGGDYPMIAVAMRELLDLAQASRHTVN